MVAGHPPARSAVSLGRLPAGGAWAVPGGGHCTPQAVSSKCFSKFTDILSRLSSICFLLLYGN